MTDWDIEKMITHAMNDLPVPWERLWIIFQKIIQLIQNE